MGYALVSHVFKKATASTGAGTTSAIDTTGATLLVAACSWYAPLADATTGTISDSKGNTWTRKTNIEGPANAGGGIQFFECVNPTVGSGHTFTWSGTSIYGSISVSAWSGSKSSSPFERDGSANGAAVTHLASSSITPDEDNELICTATGEYLSGSVPSVGGGFTVPTGHAVAGSAAVNVGHGFAYLIQTSKAAANPDWNWTASSSGGSIVAAWKAEAAGASSQIKKADEVVLAAVKKIDGIAIASVKKRDTVANS